VPEVSVIIPCYNHGHYLADALDSVLAQTYTDWEAIVVDDGSTDNSAIVARGYVTQNVRVRYIHQPNAGLSAARNAGIDVARGEYLAFLDADDSWEAEFLATTVRQLHKRHDLSGVYTRALFTDARGALLPMEGGMALDTAATRRRLLRGGATPVHAFLVRTQVVRDAGQFDTSLTSAEDWDLWLRIAGDGDMAGIPEPLVRYRLVAGSMSTDVERMHRNRIVVLTKHYGSPEGRPDIWALEKRQAYAWAYQAAAVQYITQGQPGEGWARLLQSASIWPEILLQPETHYELACWDQPRGYRGQAESLDLARNASLLLAGLERLFAQGGNTLQDVRRAAFGQAYLALAMLADQAGRWGLARAHLVRAVRWEPQLLWQPVTARRLARLVAGRRLVTLLRALGRGAAPS
jgi:glycosyltransferase involved in cell wall biosynthesis